MTATLWAEGGEGRKSERSEWPHCRHEMVDGDGLADGVWKMQLDQSHEGMNKNLEIAQWHRRGPLIADSRLLSLRHEQMVRLATECIRSSAPRDRWRVESRFPEVLRLSFEQHKHGIADVDRPETPNPYLCFPQHDGDAAAADG